MRFSAVFSLGQQALLGAGLGLIALYRVCVSPLLGPRCRFYPSCSQYAAEALQGAGFFKGVFFALRRVMKCHPFHPGGVDYFEQRT
ncbi:MAG: membrane protein insertion efficiency factor YidD [Omnitrophica bacterium GWA2_52_12]|nr:MAG: membrane protein insertion efficiency factor YidD [Omnitrophica bacterium GWA2_52_12]